MTPLVSDSFAIDLALRATLVLVGALLASLALRRGSAVARHAFWTVVTVALLLLPALNAALPPLTLNWIPAATAVTDQPPFVVASEAISIAAQTASMPSAPSVDGVADISPMVSTAAPLPLSVLALIVWLLGTLACALPVLLGVRRARLLIRGADQPVHPRVQHHADSVAASVGIRRPFRVAMSTQVRTPMTSGVLRPVVLLPMEAPNWDDDQLNAVLRHELVHARRADVLWQLLSRLSVACYWFHPLAWDAARRASLAREQACDEAVLQLGTRPSQYARHLLDLAEPRTDALMLPAMVRLDHPHLEERVMAILTSTPARHSRRSTLFASAAVVAWTLGVASATPGMAQVPLPPEPPAAREVPAAPSLPVAPPSPVVAPAAPSPAVAPAPPVAPANWASAELCTFRDGSYRTDGNGGRARVLTTTEGGIRICAAISGDAATSGFLPAGDLPAGATMTLATWSNGRSLRMVITGGNSRATPQWFVDGNERPYDQTAAEWRTALLDLVRSLDDKHTVLGQRAELMGVIARARGRDAEVRGRIAQVRGENAQLAAEVARVRSRIAVENAEVARQRAVEVRSAEASEGALVSRRTEAVRVSDTHRRALEAEVAAASGRRDAYMLEDRVAALNDERRALRTDEAVRAVQRQIEGLDAERRIADAERRMTQQVTRLQRAIESVR